MHLEDTPPLCGTTSLNISWRAVLAKCMWEEGACLAETVPRTRSRVPESEHAAPMHGKLRAVEIAMPAIQRRRASSQRAGHEVFGLRGERRFGFPLDTKPGRI